MSHSIKKQLNYRFFLYPFIAFGIILFSFACAPIALHSQENTDPDGDGLTDAEEAIYHTDPLNADTDGDSYFDGDEVNNGYSPLAAGKVTMSEHDEDGDGLNDALEVTFGADLGKIDTDGDGFSDLEEIAHGYSPVSVATTTAFVRVIEVDKTHQQLYFLVNGVRLFDFPVSTGNPWTETPSGDFVVQAMIPNKRYVGIDYDLPNVHWNMRFKPHYYIHAAYWHANFGMETMSHGCVNMREADAKKLYQYVVPGIAVHIYGTTPPRRVVEIEV